MTGLRTLEIDIETKPALVWAWGLWDQNIAISQIAQPPGILCFAYRWSDERKIHFVSEWEDGRKEMIRTLHALLDEADIVVGWNSQRFDVPWVNGEIIREGMTPPSPFVHFDLMKAYKKTARYLSYKLDYVSQTLLGGGKLQHEGFDLWLKVMGGDEKAQRRMERYNIRDVRLLGPLAAKIRPWVNLPVNEALAKGEAFGCPACGGTRLERRGYAHTNAGKYPRYRCLNKACGKWSKGNRSEQGTRLRNIPR